MTTKDSEKEPFLSRWSRLKENAREEPQKAPEEPAIAKQAEDSKAPPELPPVEKLTLDSDYRAFFNPKVDEETRRAALKKLFSNAHFKTMDGLDVYIDDYSKPDPIPAAMLATLKQAQNILEWARGEKREGEQERGEQHVARVAEAGAGEPAPLPHPEPAAAAVRPKAESVPVESENPAQKKT
jgi:hypothetical protein